MPPAKVHPRIALLSAHRAQPAQLRGPQRPLCGSANGAGRIPPQQDAGRLPDQRVPRLLHDCCAICRAAGGPLLPQADHCAGGHVLERAHAAHRAHPHLWRIAGAAHAGRNRRSYVCHHRAGLRRRPFLGRQTRPHSRRVLFGHSGRVGGGIPAGRLAGAALRMALPVLHRRGPGLPSGRDGFIPQGTAARAIRYAAGNPGSQHDSRPAAQCALFWPPR